MYVCMYVLCENMTSSTKPEVHNVSHLLSESNRAAATGNMYKNFTKFVRVVSIYENGQTDKQANKQTDIQTCTHADRNALRPYRQ